MAESGRLLMLVALTMCAFAANSVLNRMALEGGHIGPGLFSTTRLASGAAMLLAVSLLRGARGSGLSPLAPLSLAIYAIGFSYAYVTLDTGVGALILFGGVQITMFAGALILRESLPPRRWVGAVMAFGGLCWLLWPGGMVRPDPAGAALMVAAATGWGVFSLIGRGVSEPVSASAKSFALALPLAVGMVLILPDAEQAAPAGIGLAILSGAVTSGLGYVLWYTVLPRLDASIAAVAQLTVPVIAMAGGALLLAEIPGWRTVLAAAIVLGGVALASLKR